ERRSGCRRRRVAAASAILAVRQPAEVVVAAAESNKRDAAEPEVTPLVSTACTAPGLPAAISVLLWLATPPAVPTHRAAARCASSGTTNPATARSRTSRRSPGPERT